MTPKLRFPEFTDEWQNKKLDTISIINPSSTILPDLFIYIDLESVTGGRLLYENKINKIDAPSRAQRVLAKGDIIYQTVRPYQKNNLFFNRDDNNNFVASTGYAQIRAKEDSRFLYQLLHTDIFVNKVLVRSTGTNYPAINSTDLAKVHIMLPVQAEQRKIADFLTAVDDKISAIDKKVELLKEYKKGVMQEIFSQEIRFRDEGGNGFAVWENREINEISSDYDNKRKPISSEKRISGNFPYYGANGIVDYVRDYIFDGEYILVAEDGVVDITKYPIHLAKGKFWANNHCHILQGKNINNIFLYYALQNTKFSRYITGSAQTKLNNQVLGKITLNIPVKNEQQKIADFLTKLDDKINLTEQKLNQAKQFKKALLQRMFI